MNDSRLNCHYVDVGVEVYKLEDEEKSYQGELVPSAEPTKVQYLVQGNADLYQE